jgi:hypothetical protein
MEIKDQKLEKLRFESEKTVTKCCFQKSILFILFSIFLQRFVVVSTNGDVLYSQFM